MDSDDTEQESFRDCGTTEARAESFIAVDHTSSSEEDMEVCSGVLVMIELSLVCMASKG